MAIEFEDQAPKVTVNPRDTNKIIVQEVKNEVKISSSGPQGAIGPTGPTGATGPSGVVQTIFYGFEFDVAEGKLYIDDYAVNSTGYVYSEIYEEWLLSENTLAFVRNNNKPSHLALEVE